MVLSAQTIRHKIVIQPFVEGGSRYMGMSYGLSSAGYDIRLGSWGINNERQREFLSPGSFILAASLEFLSIPNDVVGRVHDKSTLARRGLALQNTILEPGWEGHITLELSNHGSTHIELRRGMPIAQVIFELLDLPTEKPYRGKYQYQGTEPVEAIFEKDTDNG